MTKPESVQIAGFARDLMRKSSEPQRDLLAKALERHDFPPEVAVDVISDYAMANEFISVPGILAKMREKLGPSHERRAELARATAAADQRRERERMADERDKASDVRDAEAFCRAHADELDGWRATLLSAGKVPAWLRDKPVMDSLVLRCAIYSEFGRVPVQAWGGAR